MKKLKQTLVSFATIVGSLAIVPMASAASTCQNGYTGPDSNNLCTSTTTYMCTVDNNNVATINNENQQVSLSGNASSGGNTTGGGAMSGSATNTNGTTFNVSVTNQGVCTATATVPATTTPETPSTPVTPGRGSIAQPVVTPTNKVTPKNLANTSGNNMLAVATSAVAGLAATIGLARLAVMAVRRYNA
jgi:hypothetical protein